MIYKNRWIFSRTKGQITGWEKILAKDMSDKRLVSKIYKELLKLSNKETTNWKEGKRSGQTLPQRRCTDSKWVYENILRELHIKIRYHSTHKRKIKIQNSDNTKSWQGCVGSLTHCWWERKTVKPLWKTAWQFLPKPNILLPHNPANYAPWYLPKGVKKLCSHKNMPTDVQQLYS